MRLSDDNSNPLNDPPLAEAWSAFAHLASAAETPFDEHAFASRVAAEVAHQQRRRRVRIGAGMLALAASLLVIVGVTTRMPRGETALAVATPKQAAPAVGRAPEQVSPAATEPNTVASDTLPGEQIDPPGEIIPWEDDLAVEAASLASQLQSVEQHWRERPDSIALLQFQVDKFEQEIKGGEL